MKKLIVFACCILGVLTIGAVSGIATGSEIQNWYRLLNKPIFNPPNYLFGPVWTLLYALMGISLALIILQSSAISKRKAYLIFAIQLVLNFFWSFIFFRFHAPGSALVEIVVLWVCILAMIKIFYPSINTLLL